MRVLHSFVGLFLGLLSLGRAQQHPIRQELVDAANNNRDAGWVAEDVERNMFANRSVAEIKGLMGLHDYGKKPLPAEGLLRGGAANGKVVVGDIPQAFDARTEWPKCKRPIRDQAHCGSCWAFGAAETLTDNLCVLGVLSSSSEAAAVLSPQDLISCDSADHACKGGTLPAAWKYIEANGLEADSSMPYKSGDGSCNNTCVPVCPHGFPDSSAHRCPVAPTFLSSDQDIQAAIMTVGAVEVGFFVMEDFMNYKSGIYTYQSGMQLGGHAVKVVGWGHEGEKFYWTVQNSWGPSWGEGGYFRIANWHEDKESGFALGGGQACVQGPTPAPPSPAPAPEACEDIVSYCKKYDHTKCQKESYIIPVCKETCGCCEHDVALRPPYCSNATSDVIDGSSATTTLVV